MKIAIATQNDLVSAHFGHCEGFTIYEVDKGEGAKKEFVENPGHKPGFLPVFLKQANVDLIIAGGMGQRAQELFTQQNIKVIVGAQGTCDEVIEKYNKGNLKSTAVVCNEHEHSGECGGH